MRALLLITIFAITFLSCKKDTIDLNAFWQCNNSQNLDSAAISNKLLGEWKWTKQACYSTGKTTKADKDLRVIFGANSTFTVTDNSNIVTQGTWKLKIVDNNKWGLDLSTRSEYLYGRILFCDDQVLFNDSYIDGCDNLFVSSK